MIKILLLSSVILLNLSCSTFRTTAEPNLPNPKVKPIEKPTVSTKQPLGRYDINLNQELRYNNEVSQVNQLNKMSIDANNKTSQQQLMDSLFANKNRSPRNIKSSYLKVVRDKKRALRKKLSDKRSLFFNDQKKRRAEYSEQAKIKKEKFRNKKNNAVDKKEFYKNLDLERKHFFANEKDEKKLFDSNQKSLEKEIDARFKDLDKEFEDNLKVYKSTYNK